MEQKNEIPIDRRTENETSIDRHHIIISPPMVWNYNLLYIFSHLFVWHFFYSIIFFFGKTEK